MFCSNKGSGKYRTKRRNVPTHSSRQRRRPRPPSPFQTITDLTDLTTAMTTTDRTPLPGQCSEVKMEGGDEGRWDGMYTGCKSEEGVLEVMGTELAI